METLAGGGQQSTDVQNGVVKGNWNEHTDRSGTRGELLKKGTKRGTLGIRAQGSEHQKWDFKTVIREGGSHREGTEKKEKGRGNVTQRAGADR